MRTAIVGRVDEVARLRELARRAAGGRGTVALLEGEPGVGKTTLLSVVAADARRLGARVVRSSGTQHERPLPLAAIASWLNAELAIDAAGTGAEFALTEAVLERVGAWCAAGPVALLVDDLQWADPSSMLVLGRLARTIGQLPLLLVVAYQPAPRGPEQDALLRSLRARGAVPLTLAPLAEADIATLVESLIGAPPGPHLRKLLAGAGGNPLYAMEVLGALARTGRLHVAGNVATLRHDREALPSMPGTLLGLIRRRLRALSAAGLEAVRAAAVLGPGFDLTELASVLSTPVISLWQPVSEAVAGGLLTDADGRLGFRHDLIRQALADDLPAAATAALHLRAARALAAARAPGARVAPHHAAGAALPPDMAGWLAQVAGPLTQRAPALAAELLERAVGQPGGSGEALRPQYVRALLWAGRAEDAEHAAHQAAPEGARTVPLRWLLAQAHLHRGRLDEAMSEARSVLATGAAGDPELARFQGFLAQCLLLSGHTADAEAAARHATAAPTGAAYGLSVQAAGQLLRGYPQAALDLADRALAALGSHRILPDGQLAPHLVRGLCLAELDRHTEAESAYADGMARSEPGGAFLTWYHLARTRLRYLDGRWDDALAEAGSGLEVTDRLGVAGALRTQAALIAMHRGEFATSPLLTRPDTSLGGRYWGFLRVTARAMAWEHAGQARRALDALLIAWHRGPGQVSLAPYLAPDIARLAAITGAASRARPIAEAVERLASHHPAPHVRATAALCRGVVDADPTLLASAADGFASAGWPLYEGYAHELAAAALGDADRPAEARTALQSAVACYERLDATWDMTRAVAWLRGSGVRLRNARQRPKAGWEALTDTERRIAALVANGRSNPEIATDLYLSRRTVRNHVSHILAKLGLASRVELAVNAHDRGYL
jgi:DNA-binding CsgD family transcriptional regulator